jgi:hypothetical protein
LLSSSRMETLFLFSTSDILNLGRESESYKLGLIET